MLKGLVWLSKCYMNKEPLHPANCALHLRPEGVLASRPPPSSRGTLTDARALGK